MQFVKTEELKIGMRLAKPIYNKNGVLLYDRDTKLTKQGISSIENFGLFGIYILEPTEPLPPMTEQDVEFEKFQSMAVFSLKDDLELLTRGKMAKNIFRMTNLIIKNYGRVGTKINFMQNLRSNQDYIYKHCLNTAIVATLMSTKLRVNGIDMQNMVMSALIHDAGKILIPPEIAEKGENLTDEERTIIRQCGVKGVALIQDNNDIAGDIKTILTQFRQITDPKSEEEYRAKKYPTVVKIIQIASKFDDLTAMRSGVEPESDVAAIKYFLSDPDTYDENVVAALIDSVRMLYPGICVQLTTKETGLVIKENKDNVLRPYVLVFESNKVYDLSEEKTHDKVQIDDILKSMDKRIPIDQSKIKEYLEMYKNI